MSSIFAGEYDMIQNLNLQELAPFLHPSRQINVGLAGLKVSGRMVVSLM
jgi:hypothetical protein